MIEDHFWVFFYNDRLDADGEGAWTNCCVSRPTTWRCPPSKAARPGFSPWMGYALRERAYLQTKTAYMAQKGERRTAHRPGT